MVKVWLSLGTRTNQIGSGKDHGLGEGQGEMNVYLTL